MKDPYTILGVSKTATQDEIKNAYRSLAKKNHPDLNPGNKEREAKFKDAAQAYEQIGSPEARAKFDRGETEEAFAGGRGGPYYHEAKAGGDGGRYTYSYGGGGMDDDFFENLFRQSGAGGRGGGRREHGPGEDQLYQMEVEFRDAALGAEREIALPGGKKLQIKIPAGVESGARLRFKGQGGPGLGQGAAGDAFVEIHVRPSSQFTRKGRDVESEASITVYDALLGGEVEVPTLDGNISLKVPPGVSSGSKLRIRGKGIGSKTGERGDQLVALRIVMPKSIPPEMKQMLAEWKEKHPYSAKETK